MAADVQPMAALGLSWDRRCSREHPAEPSFYQEGQKKGNKERILSPVRASFCQLDTNLNVPRKMLFQVRNYLYLIGLCTCLQDFFLITNWRTQPMVSCAISGQMDYKTKVADQARGSRPVSILPCSLSSCFGSWFFFCFLYHINRNNRFQYSLQEHTPNDLAFLPHGCTFTGSTISQYHHRLTRTSLEHEAFLGDVWDPSCNTLRRRTDTKWYRLGKHLWRGLFALKTIQRKSGYWPLMSMSFLKSKRHGLSNQLRHSLVYGLIMTVWYTSSRMFCSVIKKNEIIQSLELYL